MNNYQMFRKIEEQAKQYEEYDNFDREDLIDELLEEKRINENNLQEIDRLNNIINEAIDLLEPFVEIDMCVINGKMIKPALDKLKELKENNK